MLELDGLVGLIVVGFWLFCVFDAITTPESEVRNLPKITWIFLVIILFEIGAILWLIAGRPRAATRAGGMPYKGNAGAAPAGASRPARATRSVAPDDDPDFLRALKKSNDEHETMLSQWEADLRRREKELRDKPDDPA